MDMPSINLTLTGANIAAMREAAGLSVKDLQKFLASIRRKLSTNGKMECRFHLSIIL